MGTNAPSHIRQRAWRTLAEELTEELSQELLRQDRPVTRDGKVALAKERWTLDADLEGFEHHWQSLRRQHETSENFISLPKKWVLYCQLDYKENNTFPLGPDEGGD